MDRGIKVNRKDHPKEKSNFLSLVFFAYIFKLFRKGYKNDLEEKDMCKPMKKLYAKKVGDNLQEYWNKEQKNNPEPSILNALKCCYGKVFLRLTLIQLVYRLTFAFLQPLAFSKFISYFSAVHTDSDISKNEVWSYACLLIILQFLEGLITQHFLLYKAEFALQIQLAISSLIYRKTLKLPTTGKTGPATGKIVTILTKDIAVFQNTINYLSEVLVEIIQLCMLFFMIYLRLGTATYGGFTVYFICIPFQFFLGWIMYSKRTATLKKTDDRLQLTAEILSAIRVVKMYTWEKVFGKRVSHARKKELSKLKTIFFLKSSSLTVAQFAMRVSFLVFIIMHMWLGKHWNAELLYYVGSCYMKLRRTIADFVPRSIDTTAELSASIKRMNAILNAEEISHSTFPVEYKNTHVRFSHVSVSIAHHPILKNVNLEINPGLNIVIGTIGCGKSSLLKTILQDYPVSSGKTNIQGTVSYASQNPWLFPSSIKQNILFGQAFNANRYRRVLKVCALNQDMSTFANGDETILSDGGVNLSKGQQYRVNLARALYKESDIYLLDDCLAALDNHVKHYIFKEGIRNFLKNKLCIFVTHDRQLIKHADNVICISSGSISYTGNTSDVPEEYISSIASEQLFDEPEDNSIETTDDNEEKSLLNGEEVNADQANIYHENKKAGSIDLSVYQKYVAFGGGMLFFMLVVIVTVIPEASAGYGEKLLSKWVNNEEQLKIMLLNGTLNDTKVLEMLNDKTYYQNVFMIVTMVSLVVGVISFVLFFIFATTVSKNLHKTMLNNVFRSRITFFDTHMIGSILNRFSKDMYVIDEQIPFILSECLRMACLLLGTIVLILSVNYYLIIATAVLAAVFLGMCSFFLPTGRSLRRLDAAARSPLVGHLNATLEGLTTIRAYGIQTILMDEFDKHQDYFCGVNHIMEICTRTLAFSLHAVAEVYITCVIFSLIVAEKASAGEVGLAVGQAFRVTFFLEWGIRQYFMMESQMTSMERVLEYTEVKQESQSGQTIVGWPKRGQIEFRNVSLSYRNDEQVLKNLNFTIAPKEKIGIVGRTGAGKSSIILALFRMYDIQGEILIDGKDTKTLVLELLRKHISIIPQDPVLFTGSMRTNLDPLHNCKDEDIWNALSLVNLKSEISSLDEDISKSGTTFSIGQRQLLSLARAILRKTKIIILDEATANMDEEMDKFIQEKIEEHFKDCTTITVAHRLPNVMKCDRILVLDKGEIVEFDKPSTLIQNEESYFYQMVHS